MIGLTSQVDGNTVINTIDGTISYQRIIDFIKDKIGSWENKVMLWDLRDANLSGIPSQQMRSLARTMIPLAERRAGLKTAVVAPSDLQYGTMRVYKAWASALGTATDIRIFRTSEEALDWLQEEPE